MKIFCFDAGVGREMTHFGGVNVIQSRIAALTSQTQVSCMYLQPEGRIGYHQAATPQLFLVVDGTGWVRGEAVEGQPLEAGQAAFWEKGEWHESRTETGMTALVIEVEMDAFDPGMFMPEC
ncbi:MAG: hypothetical protein PVI99_05995 [Anaerolineales bacterium]|jgi:quercetin dioxygenase-like cupin family protein